MIRIVHGIIRFNDPSDKEKLLQLMRDQSSCSRAAYQLRYKKSLIKRKDLYSNLSVRFGDRLKAIQIYDAIDRVKGLGPNVIFGGKKLWNSLISKKITKEVWKNKRDLFYYASGDSRNKGNRSVRIVDDTIKISSGRLFREYIIGNIWIPKKFQQILNLRCYNVKIRYENNEFKTQISFEFPDPKVITSSTNGLIGVDTNPDGFGISETNYSGNLVSHCYLIADRMKFARTNKRIHDSRILAKKVVDFSLETGKSIALERLQFGKIKFVGRRWNRIRANFVYSKLIEAVRSRARKFGVEIVEVNPAYTSKLGGLKYKKMYSLSIHESAALVIARRAQGFAERKDFAANPAFGKVAKMTRKTTRTNPSCKLERVKPNLEQVHLAGRGFSMTVRKSSWLWFQKFLKPYPSSQDPFEHRVQNPAFNESASNGENRDLQQVNHVKPKVSGMKNSIRQDFPNV